MDGDELKPNWTSPEMDKKAVISSMALRIKQKKAFSFASDYTVYGIS